MVFNAVGIKICLLGHDIMLSVKYLPALCLKIKATCSSDLWTGLGWPRVETGGGCLCVR